MHPVEERIQALEGRIEAIEAQLTRVLEVIDGRYDEHDKRFYGGLQGFGGDLGRINWLQDRVNHLVKALDLRFKNLGEKMDWHDFVYNKGLEHEMHLISEKPGTMERKLP